MLVSCKLGRSSPPKPAKPGSAKLTALLLRMKLCGWRRALLCVTSPLKGKILSSDGHQGTCSDVGYTDRHLLMAGSVQKPLGERSPGEGASLPERQKPAQRSELISASARSAWPYFCLSPQMTGGFMGGKLKQKKHNRKSEASGLFLLCPWKEGE